MSWEMLYFCFATILYYLVSIKKTFNIKLIKKLIRKKRNDENENESKESKRESFIRQILDSISSFNFSFILVGTMLETYLFGARLLLNVVSNLIGYLLALTLIRPFFYNLKDDSIKTPFDYLEKRYTNGGYLLKVMCSFSTCLFYMIFMTLNLWASAIILNTLFQQLPIWSCSILLGSLSLIGSLFKNGYKQYKLIRLMQIFLILTSLITSIVFSLFLNREKSAQELWQIAYVFGRLKYIDYSFDFKTRYTIWNQMFSSPFAWCVINTLLFNNFQKFRKQNTNLKSKIFIISNLPTVVLSVVVYVIAGLVCFVHFYGCDPIKQKQFSNNNQLGLYWIIQCLNSYTPYLTGFMFSSIIMNSIYQHSNLTCIITSQISDHFLIPVMNYFKFNQQNQISKLKVLKFFLLIILNLTSVLVSIMFTFARNSLLSIFFLFSNSLNPPLLGVILISIFNRYANFFGVSISFLICIFLTVWLAFGRMIFMRLYSPEFTPNTFLCNTNSTNSTNSNTFKQFTNQPASNLIDNNKFFSLYAISSLWYPLFSVLFILIFGSFLSFLYSYVRTRSIDLDSKIKQTRDKYAF